MSIVKDLEWTFNTKAETYEKMRPGYVPDLYDDIFKLADVNANSNVVEIGIGGGQATLPILKTGCRLTAVEYGENFAQICREKFKDYSSFLIIVGKFEEVALKENFYNLIFSASAFHWIPEEIGYPKVLNLLKSGGVFARFANHPYRNKGNPDLAKVIDHIYALYYYKFYNKTPQILQEYSEQEASARADIAKKYGFVDVSYKLYNRTRIFTSEEYIELLGTYSDHIAIEENIRKKFFSEIKSAIDNFGGKIDIYDTIDLQLARKQ